MGDIFLSAVVSSAQKPQNFRSFLVSPTMWHLTLAKEGETVGLVGESRCRKGITMRSILRLIPSLLGRIMWSALFHGNDVLKMSPDEIRLIRGAQSSMVLQGPMTSFNPVRPIFQLD